MSTLEPKAAQLAEQFWRQRSLVLVAEPGAGKTTVLPRALMQHPQAPQGQIWVLEPRRLAAQMAATYVARGLGEQVGKSVGYRIRFDDKTCAKTRIVYMTDGILARHLCHHPTLPNVACVLFDEFHERTLAQDLALGALLALRTSGRTQVALGAMSATLDAGGLSQLLGVEEPTFVAGRTYAVEVSHVPQRITQPWPQAIAQALRRCFEEPCDAADARCGNVLVFLPGARAIHAAMAACAHIAQKHGARCLPLYASLDARAQAEPFAAHSERLVIFATNVAETSLTLPGVRTVIDTGLSKQARQLPLSGITELKEGGISQASAVQRAGRAGRVAPGRCIRLYTLADFRRRPAFDEPEVARLDLAPALLFLAQLNLGELTSLPLIDPLAPAAVNAAQALLLQLGALAPNGDITALGRRMAELPLHPRLSRMLLRAEELGIAGLGAEAVASLSEDLADAANFRQEAQTLGDSDLQARCLQVRHCANARRVAQTLRRSLHPGADTKPIDAHARLTEAALAGFGDRVGKRLPPLGPMPGELPLAMARGGRAVLARHSEVRASTFVLALQAEARPPSAARGPPGTDFAPLRVSCAIGLEADALLDAGAPFVTTSSTHSWDAGRGRVMQRERICYDGLTLLEEQAPEADVEQALPLLKEAFWRAHGQSPSVQEPLQALAVRLRLAATLAPTAVNLTAGEVETTVRTALEAALATWAQAGQSFKTLQVESLWPMAHDALAAPLQRALHHSVPTHVTLAHGRRLAVTYSEAAPPFVASFLQDFFGAKTSPTLADGKLALTVHLWGPNRRPLQVTADLASFWQQQYPKLRPALARRYQRHAWPEDPLQAAPGRGRR